MMKNIGSYAGGSYDEPPPSHASFTIRRGYPHLSKLCHRARRFSVRRTTPLTCIFHEAARQSLPLQIISQCEAFLSTTNHPLNICFSRSGEVILTFADYVTLRGVSQYDEPPSPVPTPFLFFFFELFSEVILTFGNSTTVEGFLKAAASAKDGLTFRVIVAEAAPSCSGHVSLPGWISL